MCDEDAKDGQPSMAPHRGAGGKRASWPLSRVRALGLHCRRGGGDKRGEEVCAKISLKTKRNQAGSRAHTHTDSLPRNPALGAGSWSHLTGRSGVTWPPLPARGDGHFFIFRYVWLFF